MSEMRASIDIGSNSVLLLIADVENNNFISKEKRSFITSLGKDLDKTGCFHPDSMEATLHALREYANICKSYGIDSEKVLVTATEAARVAKNAKSFFEKVEAEIGFKTNIINAQAEAYFSSKGILFNSTFPTENITIMDIGGASTELINVNTKKFNIVNTISLPVGAVRATGWLAEDLFVQNLQKIFLDFRVELDSFQTKILYCVAGTITSLGNMHLLKKDFVEDDVHGLMMSSDNIDFLFKKYSDWSVDQFNNEFPFLMKRSNSIRGGLHLVYHMMNRLLVKEIYVSTYGLRYGTLLEGKIKKEFLCEQ